MDAIEFNKLSNGDIIQHKDMSTYVVMGESAYSAGKIVICLYSDDGYDAVGQWYSILIGSEGNYILL